MIHGLRGHSLSGRSGGNPLDQAVFTPIAEVSTLLAALPSGDLGFIAPVPPTSL